MTTTITSGEIKIVFFCIMVLAIMGTFAFFYNASPIPVQGYGGKTSVGIETSTNQDTWILGLLDWVPAPFDSEELAPIRLIIIDPIKVILGFIALRFLKDIITGWV